MVALDWHDIQGNVLRGYGLPHAAHAVLTVTDPAAGRRWLGELLPEVTPATPWGQRPATTLNLALTHRGIATLAPDPGALALPEDLRQGMPSRAATHLGDVGPDGPDTWEAAGVHDPRAHVLLMIHATSAAAAGERLAGALTAARARGLELLATEELAQLPGRREHFGFVDGISQPAVEGARPPTVVRGNGTPLPGDGWRPVRAGEFVLGYPDEEEDAPPLPGPPQLTRNGSYLVYRKLAQDVAGFRRLIAAESRRCGVDPDVLAAKLVGRHADGAPLVPGGARGPAPGDGPAAGGAPDAPARSGPHPSARLNDVRFADDPTGAACPVTSHVRRANPRDAFGLEPELVSRHRLLRRGMPYGPPLPDGTDEDDGIPRGLLFMAYCASISRQFELVQRQWLNDGSALRAGRTADPVAGHGTADRRFACLPPDGAGPDPVLLGDIPRLVRARGGEYLFQPGLGGLRHLASG